MVPSALLVVSSLYVPAIATIPGFMLPTLPDFLLAVAGGILSVAWFDLLKVRLAGRPTGP
jgi:hypothetical protein